MLRFTSFPRVRISRVTQATALVVFAATAFACADQAAPTPSADDAVVAPAAPVAASTTVPAPVPIFSELLTARHAFTDRVSAHLRVKPRGRRTETINIKDASHVAVVRFTVQPGVRFPWHTHPGSVIVSVTKGSLTFVYADDCVRRPYQTGEAFVDPGFGNVHYAFNPTAGETEIVATFLGIPATGPLTNAVDAPTSAKLDSRCRVPAAAAHSH